MNLKDSPEQQAFRAEIRQWLKANLPPGWGTSVFEPKGEDERAAFRLEWEKKLYQGGWSGITWPKQYGGRGASPIENAITSPARP